MIIDADSHFTPQLELQGSEFTRDWIKKFTERKNIVFGDPENRRREMNMLGVDRQLLNPMGSKLGLNYQIDQHTSVEIMNVYNRTMYDLVNHYDCYDMNLWVGLQNINESICEINRYAHDPKVFGVFVSDSPLWGFIKELEPVWAVLEKIKMPWYLHITCAEDEIPFMCSIPDPYKNLHQKLQNSQWLMSIASIIIGGVLTRYPDLKIVIAERDIDWISQFQQDMLELTGIDPLPYFKKNFWFTTEPESPTFLKDAEIIGFDRLLFATDWPHDHDIGGSNSRKDVATVNSLNLSTENLELLCKNNYINLQRS
jgi:predicted TIM-barrel fold metal-dependent hydrolase